MKTILVACLFIFSFLYKNILGRGKHCIEFNCGSLFKDQLPVINDITKRHFYDVVCVVATDIVLGAGGGEAGGDLSFLDCHLDVEGVYLLLTLKDLIARRWF